MILTYGRLVTCGRLAIGLFGRARTARQAARQSAGAQTEISARSGTMSVLMRLHLSLLFALYSVPIAAQNTPFPLESVKIEGSAILQPIILDIAGLHMKAPIDDASMQQACQKLQ